MVTSAERGLQLDAIDRRLINLLQDDCRRSVLELAALAEISAPTCHRRLKRLRSSGLIRREGALIDPAKSPRSLSMFVSVTTERHDDAVHAAFEARMASEPAVSQCYNVNGAVDYLVALDVRDIEEYHELSQRLFAADPQVRTYRSMFVIRRVKFDPRIEF